MSFVDDATQQLILDLLLGRISEHEFLQRFAPSGVEASRRAAGMLERSLAEQDPSAVELALHLLHRFGVPPESVGVLEALAEASWHTRHEDVVDALANLKLARSVSVLDRVARARHAYLEFDEAYALGTKCIRALGQIGVAEARDRVESLRGCGNPVLEDEATRELARMESGAKA